MQDLTHIAVFMRVVDEGSFTAAAHKLGMSRPTVSKSVATLEQQLGARLLNRTTRRLGLTEIGTHFYAHCEKIMAELEIAKREVSRFSDAPHGCLRISVQPCFGIRCMASKLRDFLDLYPDIEIDLMLDARPVDLIAEGIDLVIRVAQREPQGLCARRLVDCAHLVCGAPSYFERCGLPRTPGDLANHNCLGYAHYGAGDTWCLEGPQGLESVTVKGRLQANSGDALRVALLSGLGLGLMPTFLVDEDIKAGRLRNALPGYQDNSYSVIVVYPQGGYVAPKVQVFIEYLVENFHERVPPNSCPGPT